jgi:hypothetical protein
MHQVLRSGKENEKRKVSGWTSAADFGREEERLFQFNGKSPFSP